MTSSSYKNLSKKSFWAHIATLLGYAGLSGAIVALSAKSEMTQTHRRAILIMASILLITTILGFWPIIKMRPSDDNQ